MASKPMFINKQYAKDLLLQFDTRLETIGSNEVLAKEQLERQKEKTSIRFYSASKSVTSVTRAGLSLRTSLKDQSQLFLFMEL